MIQLFRNKCECCSCYCIFEYIIEDKKINIKCTHCRNQVQYSLDEQPKIEKHIKQVEEIIKAIQPFYADLQKLKRRGDFARPPFKIYQKSDERNLEMTIVESHG